MSKKIAIILSTFNGEKYLREQLDSILNQSYKNFDLYIYDDCSKDNTKEIIREYTYDNRIHIIESKTNLGYPKGFIHALRHVDGYEYYSFADQDDVWNSKKIEEAIYYLEKVEGKNIPQLYYTAVDYYDVDLNFIRHSRFNSNKKDVKSLNLQELILGGEALGMTFVINDIARKKLIDANNNDDYKDWFLKILCASNGVVIYNPNPSAKYRRHSEAVTVSSNPSNKIKRYIVQINDIFFNSNNNNSLVKSIHYLYSNEYNKIKKENVELVSLFNEDKTIKTQIKKLFWPHRFRVKIVDEFGYRIAFLLFKV